MQLIDYHQLIIQGMFHLNEWSHFDCLWLSENYEKVHAFATSQIPSAIDFNEPEILNEIKNLCLAEQEVRFCIVGASTNLEFIFLPLTFEGSYQGLLRIGPYLTSPVDDQMFSSILYSRKIPLKEHLAIRHYYDTLPKIANQVDLNLGHIAMNLFGYTLPLTNHCNYIEKTSQAKKYKKPAQDSQNIHFIEERYEFERKLRHAIATSNRGLLDEAMSFFKYGNFLHDRYPDNPLRSAKNITIVLNTILRHGAEDGCLHPYYLDQISTKYALLIEQAATRTAINQLQKEMYEAYFLEVKQHAYASKSPFIRRVINRIQLNLEDDMTLSSIAEEFHIQPSNLANQFKAETGYTISEFINLLRIENACYYIKNSEVSIHEIGMLVGYTDANYFSRVFKKIKGMSPSAYRNL